MSCVGGTVLGPSPLIKLMADGQEGHHFGHVGLHPGMPAQRLN